MEERRAVLGSERISRRRFNALVSLFFFVVFSRAAFPFVLLLSRLCISFLLLVYTLLMAPTMFQFLCSELPGVFFFFSSCSPLVGPVTPVLNRKANEVGVFFLSFLMYHLLFVFLHCSVFFFFKKYMYFCCLCRLVSFFFLTIYAFFFLHFAVSLFFFFLLSKPVVEMPRH